MSDAPNRYQQLAAEVKRHIREISVAELPAALKAQPAPLVIDVREADEAARGGIPGAVHLSRGIIESWIEDVAPNADTPLILYCASGNRSAFAADNLQKMGYGDVRSLKEGIKGWIAAGQPLEKLRDPRS